MGKFQQVWPTPNGKLHMVFFGTLVPALSVSLSSGQSDRAPPEVSHRLQFGRSVTKNDTSLSNWYRDATIRLFVFGFHVKGCCVCVSIMVTYVCVFVHGKTGTILLLDTHIMWQFFGWQECCTHCVYTYTPKKGETYVVLLPFACVHLWGGGGGGSLLGGDRHGFVEKCGPPSFIVMWIRTCAFCTKLYVFACVCVCVNDEKQMLRLLNFQKLMES